MVIGIDRVDVSCAVDADVDELVPVIHVCVRIVVYCVVGESVSAVYRYRYPDRVDVAGDSARC